MTDRLAQVHAHLDRLRKEDPQLAEEMAKLVDKIESMDPAEACRTWQEKAKAKTAETKQEGASR